MQTSGVIFFGSRAGHAFAAVGQLIFGSVMLHVFPDGRQAGQAFGLGLAAPPAEEMTGRMRCGGLLSS